MNETFVKLDTIHALDAKPVNIATPTRLLSVVNDLCTVGNDVVFLLSDQTTFHFEANDGVKLDEYKRQFARLIVGIINESWINRKTGAVHTIPAFVDVSEDIKAYVAAIENRLEGAPLDVQLSDVFDAVKLVPSHLQLPKAVSSPVDDVRKKFTSVLGLLIPRSLHETSITASVPTMAAFDPNAPVSDQDDANASITFEIHPLSELELASQQIEPLDAGNPGASQTFGALTSGQRPLGRSTIGVPTLFDDLGGNTTGSLQSVTLHGIGDGVPALSTLAVEPLGTGEFHVIDPDDLNPLTGDTPALVTGAISPLDTGTAPVIPSEKPTSN